MFTFYRVIETDNFDGDYPNERFVEPLPAMTREQAQAVADAINASVPENYDRYWRVVDNTYQLRPGFEP